MLSITAAQGAADGSRPGASPWQPVTLPDDWSKRWPDYSGTVWYRIDWQRQCPDGQSGPVGLTLESVVMAGEVFINDELIWRDAHLTEPLSRSWNLPRYWRLPESLLRDGVNTLWLRVVGVSQQTPGLGPVHLGAAQAMHALQEDLWWNNRTLYVLNLIISAVLGALFFCIWIVRREQTTYGWYALMALFWVLFVANVLATSPWPFATTLMAARANSMALVLYTACFCLFTWRFSERFLPRTERVLWAVAAAMLAILAITPDTALPEAQRAAVLGSAGIFLANCLQFCAHAWRTRRPEQSMLAACLLIIFVVIIHDLLRLMKLIGPGPTYTSFSSIAVTLCMSAILGLRHARNVRRIERFNHELADSIAEARTELATTLEREHALAMSNTRLQERLQIAHDLHDGLGGSLVRMMAMVEQAKAPLQGQQFLSMLKLLRDDLRQTIDSGSSAGVKVPETPPEWAAPLRHRFVQLFDELDLDSSWQFPPQWTTPPSPLQCLALTRLVEEALTNVVKHSRARRVQLQLQQPQPDQLQLRIEDDGAGFDVAAVRQAGVSVGMRSMHARITRVHGTLDISSAPGKTVLTAVLQLRPAAAQSV
ncbi:MAG: 7TM diverse intracellular signaling domain-containing protein [Achromobacter marplatensis]|uniref:sensor histidine kinase n=1 Tax=Achromobacter marplatensis TaxID=470868 RepID=UPI003D0110BE